jgi:hypothetical protein
MSLRHLRTFPLPGPQVPPWAPLLAEACQDRRTNFPVYLETLSSSRHILICSHAAFQLVTRCLQCLSLGLYSTRYVLPSFYVLRFPNHRRSARLFPPLSPSSSCFLEGSAFVDRRICSLPSRPLRPRIRTSLTRARNHVPYDPCSLHGCSSPH